MPRYRHPITGESGEFVAAETGQVTVGEGPAAIKVRKGYVMLIPDSARRRVVEGSVFEAEFEIE